MSRRDRSQTPQFGRAVVAGAAIVLLLGLLLAVFFNRLATGNLILARGDTLLYFYPYWQAAAEALKAGRIPLWNPSLFMGAPFLANSQAGFLYPLNWPFWLLMPTPYAASFSILLHLLLAGLGVVMMGRRCLSLTRTASFLAAVLFMLGGYLVAQVEHINQVQGLAWLPWYFVVLCPWRPGLLSPGQASSGLVNRRRAARVIVGFSAFLSLQILSGHSQTVFISMVAVAIWLATTFVVKRDSEATGGGSHARLTSLVRQGWAYFGPVILAVALAACMTAAQLLPTLELSRQSLRAGGLSANEVLSFSLPPLLLGQSLLPAYDRLVFSEYVLVLPITALLLAAIGVWRLWASKEARPFLILAGTGLFLALGRFNPLYYGLARLPGFNIFRAPTRWSVLYALAIALLAAAGWQALSTMARDRNKASASIKEFRALIAGVVIVLGIIGWSLISVPLAEFIPTAPEALVEQPTLNTIVAWIGELALAGALIYLIIRGAGRHQLLIWFVLIGTVMMLFLGTRILPYANPTTPEAYFDLRASASRLLATADCDATPERCASGAGRVLSLSDIFFDVGDQAEIDSVYATQLGVGARFDYTVAIKQKEILGPNLPLAYGLESVDGFDGGVLPLRTFATLMGLVLPEGTQSFDGRLREHLDSFPEDRWLDLFGARYIITDKVGDEWRREVFFDMKHPVQVSQNDEPISIGYLPPYEATETWLIADGPPGTLTVTAEGQGSWRLAPEAIEPDLWRASFPAPMVAESITLGPCKPGLDDTSCPAEWHVQGLALVDSRDDTFTPIVIGNYRLVHSGDVKMYENLDVLPRAFLLHDWHIVQDDEQALAIMRSPEFDPHRAAVVHSDGPQPPGSGQGEVTIIRDEPERIVLRSDSEAAALLLLTEAFYPGWKASVDGQPAEVARADILLRGIYLSPGEHEIVMEFRPLSYSIGRAVSLLGLFLWLSLFSYAYLLPLLPESVRIAWLSRAV